MNLTFKTEHIVPELSSSTGLQVIGEIVEHLVFAGAIPRESAGKIAMAVRQREHSMSTGLGMGIALPHASTPLVNEIIIAFGRSLKGIDFDSVDGELVRHVVLVIVPTARREKQFQYLARLARLLHSNDVRIALDKAQDRNLISDVLNGTPLLVVAE